MSTTSTHESPVKAFHLAVLGSFGLVDGDGRSIEHVVAQPKRFALLVYLTLRGRHAAVSRDELLATFWAEYPEDRARNALTQALSFLRRALGHQVIRNVGVHAVSIDPSLVRCDATDLLDAVDAGERARAVELYTGALLPGFFAAQGEEFERWHETERARLHRIVVDCARALAADGEATGDEAGALRWARHAFRLEPLDERVVRSLMRAYAARGDRTDALRVCDEYASALRREFDASPLPETIELRDAIRLAGTGDAAVAMAPTVGLQRASVQVSARETRPWARTRTFAMGMVAIATVAVILAAAKRRPQGAFSPPSTNARLSVLLPDSIRLRAELNGHLIAIDPAGTRIAYVGGSNPEQIYVRDLDESTPRPVPGTERARLPQFSPNGEILTFVRDGRLYAVSRKGGEVRTLLDSANRYSAGTDESIVFEKPYGSLHPPVLYRVTKAGGHSQPLTRLDSSRGDLAHVQPFLLPGARVALFEITGRNPDSSELAAVRISDGSVVLLGIRGHNPRFVAPHSIIFSRRDGVILGASFDTSQLRLIGEPKPLLADVDVRKSGLSQVALSTSGTLLYLPLDRDRQLLLVDPAAKSSRVIVRGKSFSSPRFSPDGRKVAVVIGNAVEKDVWLVDVPSGAMTRFTDDGRSDVPEWTPDGRRILWRTERGSDPEIWWRSGDGSDSASLLLRGATRAMMAPGSRIIVATVNGRSASRALAQSQLWLIRLNQRLQPLDTIIIPGVRPSISPDGKLLAYMSIPHVSDVYVRELAPPYRTIRASHGGAEDPVWGGQELFYRSGGHFFAARIDAHNQPTVANRRTVAPDQYWGSWASNPHFDVSSDGQQLLVVRTSGVPDQPVVVFDWGAAITERLKMIPKTTVMPHLDHRTQNSRHPGRS